MNCPYCRNIVMERGFTLIEIIMVIILLGIIAAVAVPRFIDFSRPAKENVTRQKMEVLRKAIVGDPSAVAAGTYSSRGYRGDVGSMPSALSQLTSHNVTWNRYTKTGYNGPYIDVSSGEPFRDAWGNDFVYDSTATPPTITSCGPDGSCATTGDNIVVELRY
jgi:prepilin-type N-terminal cleavage/methylation domain-containing protein